MPVRNVSGLVLRGMASVRPHMTDDHDTTHHAGDAITYLLQSPPLVPAAPFQPTRAQIRFMRLHAWHLVEKWQWHWLQTMLRATTDRGVTATLWVDSVEELVREGLMEASMGYAMSVTDAGRELLARERNRV